MALNYFLNRYVSLQAWENGNCVCDTNMICMIDQNLNRGTWNNNVYNQFEK